MHRGLKKNQHYTWLICAAQNMKNIAIKKDKVNGTLLTNTSIIKNFIDFIKKIRVSDLKCFCMRKPLEKI